MERFEVRWLRLAVVAGAIAGSALVSSAVVAMDESPPIDESIVVEAPPDLPLEDVAVIEMVIVESDVTEPGASGSDATEAPLGDAESDVKPGEVLTDEPEAEVLPGELVAEVLPDAEVLSNEPPAEVLADARVLGTLTNAPVAASLDHVDDTDYVEEGSTDEGHQNENVGEGNPYLVTFEVEWLDSRGTPIGVLDAVLPLEWRLSFELSADSLTGQGETSAICTYPAGSDVLQCVFDTAGHGSGSDGLIVPGSKHAQYTVTVVWPPADWTNDGANDGPSSARKECPRGQGGGGDGHEEGDDGHEEGDDGHEEGDGGGQGDSGQGGGENDGRRTVRCVHRVVMQQIAMVVPPTEPPAVQPQLEVTQPVVPDATQPVVPDATPPVVPDATPPVVAPAEATPPVVAAASGALPATGGSISVLLVLAGLLVFAGSTVALFSRRTS